MTTGSPSVLEIYPSGIVQNVAEQKSTFSHQMEGQGRSKYVLPRYNHRRYKIIQYHPG